MVVGRDQPVTHASVSCELKRRSSCNVRATGRGSPVGQVAEVDAFIKIPAAGPYVNRMLALIGQIRYGGDPVVVELDVHTMTRYIQKRLGNLPPETGGDR